MREIVPNLGLSTFEKNTTTLANENRGSASDHAQQIDFQTSMDKQFEADDIEKNQPSSSDETCLASNTYITMTDLIIKKSALANTGNSWESAGSVVYEGQNNKKTAQTLDANPLVSPDNQAANITIRFSANYSFDSTSAKSISKSLISTANQAFAGEPTEVETDKIFKHALGANNVGKSATFSTKNIQTDVKSHLNDTQVLKMQDAQWKSSISNKIMDNINAGKQDLELVVVPKSLGKIAIQISANGDLTNIKMFTDSAKTAGLLGAALPEIEENLREVGLDLLETNAGWNGSQTKHGMRQNTENELSPREREEQKSQQEDVKTTSKLSSVDYHIGEYSYEV